VRIAHTHLILAGFVMMIMGVALWMFPRPTPDDTRNRPAWMELVWWVMTVSVSLRTAAEVAAGWRDLQALRVVVFAASAGEVLGIALFFWNLWTRIRSPREAAAKSLGTRETKSS
jgi:heme/copper-type cytochrome/quinol oxidase subunit 1